MRRHIISAAVLYESDAEMELIEPSSDEQCLAAGQTL